jgi:hypothetical protein
MLEAGLIAIPFSAQELDSRESLSRKGFHKRPPYPAYIMWLAFANMNAVHSFERLSKRRQSRRLCIERRAPDQSVPTSLRKPPRRRTSKTQQRADARNCPYQQSGTSSRAKRFGFESTHGELANWSSQEPPFRQTNTNTGDSNARNGVTPASMPCPTVLNH